ncbi:Asp-tRNA(Asn)/Glu-tRNA(Gln) amidotransferase subunit GatB [Tissierella creatinophila]|uniref:Aspartyl/glutamyl-tRNA(Asn/Gln) amidotransferase subunit B n=1 Tax=Tissierella creatinophila DSM 6911 TaxID=1123403 RepID=A0A1U7M763_TISCR|nr:Asp-tRNA(Asn)/Glu-tRNA(Gln) amidotransferase subunit GatB [Tissierella creatinophila]OLS03126.1 aspartyl/glutamyl-tRNA(Asn/Gln) amidotransferase subunit B [Tissierella creatinophila DSM 6911]
MEYKTVIGLEIHVELMTKTKIFCDCTNEFGGEANTHCCPICLGMPGAIPHLSKESLEYAIKAGLSLHSSINQKTKMDRKNYFYSDLVKGYQVSQDELPICEGGYVSIETQEGKKDVHLIRIHIEEDTGKSVHTETGDTLLDYNRAGVPLIEIVSEPEMNSGEEAKLFLEGLRATLKYIEVSDCKMEEGSLRCDVNINIVDEKTGKRTTITEVKNLNSFSSAVKAIEYEEKRHIELLEKGEDTQKETRRWDEVENKTIIMRQKGGTEDYRFAVDGDILPIEVSDEWIEAIKSSMPELPHDKRDRFIKEYKLSPYDAEVLTSSKEVSIFFEETLQYIDDIKLVSNWIMGDVLRRLNEEDASVADLKFTSKDLADLLNIVKSGKINNNTGKKVLRDMFETGKKPETIVKEKGLIQISDEGELENIVEEILDKNEQSIIDFKNGKDRAVGFLVGQIMKATRGKANPQIVNKILVEKLNKR